jgi:hypothetical protein
MKQPKVKIKNKKSVFRFVHRYSVAESAVVELRNSREFSKKIIEWIFDKIYSIDNTQTLSMNQLCMLLVKYYGAKILPETYVNRNNVTSKPLDLYIYETTDTTLKPMTHYDRTFYKRGIYLDIYNLLQENKKSEYCYINREFNVVHNSLVWKTLQMEINSIAQYEESK